MRLLEPKTPAKSQQRRRLACALLVGILTLAAGALTQAARAEEPDSRWQPPETIAAAARAAAGATTSGEIETVAIDPRLKLSRCAVPLEAKLERPIERGRGTVLVACRMPSPWKLFVPVRAVNDIEALVLARNVQAGDVLTEADLLVARRSSASLPHDYLSDSAQAIGLAARRAQPAGAVVTGATLESPEVVRRGELVTLMTGDGAVSVRGEGVALEAGRLRQRIKIRSASGRVIEGTAEGPGQVRVGP